MDEKLMRAISEFVTRRINDLGADAPAAVTDAVSDVEEQRERLSAVLSEEQQPFLRDLENALMLQSGEETRYYYRAGFYDAVKFLLEWSGAD